MAHCSLYSSPQRPADAATPPRRAPEEMNAIDAKAASRLDDDFFDDKGDDDVVGDISSIS